MFVTVCVCCCGTFGVIRQELASRAEQVSSLQSGMAASRALGGEGGTGDGGYGTSEQDMSALAALWTDLGEFMLQEPMGDSRSKWVMACA